MTRLQQSVVSIAQARASRAATSPETMSFDLNRPYKDSYQAGLSVQEIRVLLYLWATHPKETTTKAISEDLLMSDIVVQEALCRLRAAGFICSLNRELSSPHAQSFERRKSRRRHSTGA